MASAPLTLPPSLGDSILEAFVNPNSSSPFTATKPLGPVGSVAGVAQSPCGSSQTGVDYSAALTSGGSTFGEAPSGSSAVNSAEQAVLGATAFLGKHKFALGVLLLFIFGALFFEHRRRKE